MVKSELVNKISELFSDIPRKAVEESVDLVFDLIIEAMSKGERVEIRGFGTFEGRRRPPRKARNPKAGTEIELPERLYPFFKASKEMIAYLNQE